jgi:hypothetical protein
MLGAGMNWSQARRLDYIDWRLALIGEVRREHLMTVFGVSMPAASATLGEFAAAHPGAMRYDKSRKCYVPARQPYRAVRGMADPNVRRALSLLAAAGHPMGWE